MADNIQLQPHPEGVLLCVRAQPGARKNEVRGVVEGSLKLAVTQIAEKGKANKALTILLASALGLKNSQVELVRGETSAEKVFLLRGVAEDELQKKLAELIRDATAS